MEEAMKAIYTPAGRALEYKSLAVNLYRGCGHGCEYCYAPAALKMGRAEFDAPRPRPGIIASIARDATELRRTKGDGNQVLMCFSCDPYQPINDEHQLARQAIEALHFHGQNVAILTKGGWRAAVDIPALLPGDEFAVTLTCLDNPQSLRWEPGAALPQERIDTLREAHDRGIYTWVSLEPVLYPDAVYEIIERTHPFVDLYKLGTLNYHSHSRTIDWQEYGERAISMLEGLGKAIYVKHDLRAKLAAREAVAAGKVR